MKSNLYDVVVIGAGSGGLTAAVSLRKVGKKVLLVEREHLGGECTNSGCIPSKALLHLAKQYWQAKVIAGETNLSEAFRKQAFVNVRHKIEEILSEETIEQFQKQGIDVVMGEASFTGKSTVEICGLKYHFKKAIIATGSSPRKLQIAGLNEAEILTNQNFFKLESVPASTLIIGGGPIGMEMGQALAMLGSKVTIVENNERFASLEDEAVSPIITKAFTDRGIKILTRASVKQVKAGVAIVEVGEVGGKATHFVDISFEKVLLAVGRTPNLPQGLNQAGITADTYGIVVNKNWQTTNKKIYALGDVAAKLKFTHVADDTARQVTAHILSKGLLGIKNKAVPKVTYTEPEIAQVGLSWAEAQTEFGLEKITRIEVPFSAVDRARTDDTAAGLLIIIAKRLSGVILGAHIIGPRAGEIISTLTLALEQNISLYQLRSTIFAYPTYSLVIKKAGDYFLAQQLKSLKSDLWVVAKNLAPKIFAVALWVTLLYLAYHFKMTNNLSFTDIALSLFHFITSTAWGPLLYILAYTIRPLTFFPGTALTILSGIFFGLYGGIFYTIIGASCSATLAYFVGRFFSQSLGSVKKLFSGWIDFLHQNPFMAILTMRLTFFPFDLVAYGAGIFKIPYPPFLLATMLGTILGITTFVAIGASISVDEFSKNGITLDAVNGKFILLSTFIFLASLAASKALGHLKK